jgi:hypothetical protein
MTRIGVLLAVGIFIGQLGLNADLRQDAALQAEETTVAGCLQAGANSGEFVLVQDEKTTYHVQAAEGVEIAAHLSHRVELTGTIEKKESNTIFNAKAVKMLSESCTG